MRHLTAALRRLTGILGLCTALGATASEPVPAPQCGIVPLLPGTPADEADRELEKRYCAIDFASSSIAICPKMWSTSPGMLVYDLAGTKWEGDRDNFETEVCARGGHARDQAGATLAMFKNSVNGRETSGTFAPSSLLYYHLSRFLKTRVQVPVAVVAEFPIAIYRQRVVAPGLRFSAESTRLKMLHAGWLEMDLALSDPEVYQDRRELFTGDGERLWGVLLKDTGRRYGAEVNGTRASGWGDGQNRDFQKTAPYLALRLDMPLAAAIAAAVTEARVDPAMAKVLPADIAPSQVAWWMAEVSEIVILDSILRQQDRIGNIDYRWRWLWAQDGEIQRSSQRPPLQPRAKLRVSWLNDNDAGVRKSYANYAIRTGMLNDWHHMDPGLYRRLQLLARELESGGETASAIRQNYRISAKEAEGVILRARQVAAYLKKRCEQGKLRFDLSPVAALSPLKVTEQVAQCSA